MFGFRLTAGDCSEKVAAEEAGVILSSSCPLAVIEVGDDLNGDEAEIPVKVF